MHFLNRISANRQPLARLVALLALVATFSLSALAQGLPPNLDFNDSPSSIVQYRSTGRAIVGVVTANVRGKIRDGRVTNLSVDVGPFTGPNKLNRLRISYVPSPSVIAPTARWYNVNATTKRLEIIKVPAQQDFTGTSFASKGFANVQITFVNGQPGKAVVIYDHQTYFSPFTPSTTPPLGTRAYEGTVMSAAPLNGRRLYYDLR